MTTPRHPSTDDEDGVLALFDRGHDTFVRDAPDPAAMPRFFADVRASIHDQVPYRIGDFEVTRELGSGGFGLVLEARDPGLDRKVAIKLCPTASKKAADALMNEARALARLSHPNVVTIHELGRSSENSEYVFFVMEHVDGQTGHQFIWRKPPPTREQILDIYCALGRGLAAVHAAGFVHGDVKPANFLLGRDGIARVADLGLAKLLEHLSASEREELRRRTGTRAYMAPESLRGLLGDARADQFSFSVALLQTYTRELPFDGKDTATVLAQIDRLERKLWHWRVPANVRPILRRGLAVDPGDRYPSMDALLDDLEQARGVITLRPGVGAPASKAMRGAFAASLMLVGALGLTVGWAGRGRVEGDAVASVGELGMPVPDHRGWTGGLALYSHAFHAIDRGDVGAGYDAWVSARNGVMYSTPGLDGELSLVLAKRVDELSPAHAAWMANGAAESFEDAQSWRRAAEARQVAAQLARAASDEGQAAYQERCVLVNALGRECY